MSEMSGDSYRALQILVPSRPAADSPQARPLGLARLVAAVEATAAHPEQIGIVVRLDDNAVLGVGGYADALLRHAPASVPIDFVVGPQVGLARSWVELAVRAQRSAIPPSHIALWGDDVVPETAGWDLALTEALAATGGVGFAYGRDGVWDHTLGDTIPGHLDLPTACVTTPLTWGLAMPLPGVHHLFVDNWWRDLGWGAGVLHYVPAHMIRHHHPISHTARSAWDDTYRAANSEHRKLEDAVAYQEWAASTAAEDAIVRLREAARLLAHP